MKAALLPDRLLVAFYLYSRERGAVYWPVSEVASRHGFKLSPGFDLMVAQQLARNDWLIIADADELDPDEDTYAKITWEGVQAAEEILEDRPEYGEPIPASDRYVSIADNQKETLSDELAALAEIVRGSNENSEEERLIALSEIAAFEHTIVQPRVASALIQRFVDTVLNWLTNKFSGAAVTEVAHRLIQALLKVVS